MRPKLTRNEQMVLNIIHIDIDVSLNTRYIQWPGDATKCHGAPVWTIPCALVSFQDFIIVDKSFRIPLCFYIMAPQEPVSVIELVFVT